MVVPRFTTFLGGVSCRLLGIITRVGIYHETGNDQERSLLVWNDGYLPQKKKK